MFEVFADQACTANIYNREFNIPCMHAAKRRYSTKIKSVKTFLKAFPRKFIPSKYTRYTVHTYGTHVPDNQVWSWMMRSWCPSCRNSSHCVWATISYEQKRWDQNHPPTIIIIDTIVDKIYMEEKCLRGGTVQRVIFVW